MYFVTLQILSGSTLTPITTFQVTHISYPTCLLRNAALLPWLREVRHEIHRDNLVFPLIVKDHFYYQVYDLRIVVKYKPP